MLILWIGDVFKLFVEKSVSLFFSSLLIVLIYWPMSKPWAITMGITSLFLIWIYYITREK